MSNGLRAQGFMALALNLQPLHYTPYVYPLGFYINKH